MTLVELVTDVQDRSPPSPRELLAVIRRIAATPLWGEAIDNGPLREDYVHAGEYEISDDAFNPSCDTESSLLQEIVELARMTLICADG